ncbi:hypothetical protein [Peptostreptococcus faecalis]|uniref:hypothetical protein n=1 Tax=Peptostreptococcus faecalis TaxID=2045015 RepID=UPI0015E13DE6|nr:hypothetical protein [Peptostreptococcus faecalis]
MKKAKDKKDLILTAMIGDKDKKYKTVIRIKENGETELLSVKEKEGNKMKEIWNDE